MPTLVLVVASVALALWCVVDLLPRSEAEVRVLPKAGWVVALVLVPLVAGVAYLLVGRAGAAAAPGGGTGHRLPGAGGGGPAAPPVRGPEDDPAFQAHLRRVAEEQRRRALGRRDDEEPQA